ncbi:haloacid dehalogenase superfamily, subfamily IA, variant 3 with third motif having DD or ED/haloacid dehalogenase superfamily, subfamily IA, variant 1 with third motif having Dx(3-4)D or Dx(3-4)E [Micromonospora pattaloongensis]|uniref:Haloacid dehalogenase superfamily, subfamily IA, variant 3 with third motif having DD or ED/haloacid dehalogenase superfamily, subfamily IA, variant 1 with third motif having Dx(3-4)D or Dx(3-4)E n=1 Tax=Micromonospora pattaloongensis TaxID=405436 RepID=A0A1H3JL49_9ACTN|nr:HAD-IA family hydrolase [Micromonospora pattaloongensis]SDY40128.1 haloacid dehalogenase superfamily, subfamily IA, variant 3 with third motif having DD or ED/haloacid dehalogenase superfamily, subfamily IA, variant 1 with third motif having Dx(3-4)D or Dx(3-4)E [Micromonospora pattaloongensis]
MTQFDAVLFDAGDTLIRLTGSGETLLHRAAAALGVDRLDPDEVARVWRRVLERAGTAEELAKGRDLSPERHREVWTALYDTAGCEKLAPGLSGHLYALTVRAESWEAFPDSVDTLRSLHERGVRIGVVSDTGFDLRPALELRGLSPFVDTVVMSYECGVCKPAATPFLIACERLGVAPERALMVGDNPLTDSGAVAAGLYAFLLPPAAAAGPRGLRHVLALV